MPMRLDRLGLRDQIQAFPLRHQQFNMGERLDVPGLTAGGAPDALGQQRHLAAFARQHRQQAVGLALVAVPEHNGCDAIQSLAAFIFSFHGVRDYTTAGTSSTRHRRKVPGESIV